MYSVKREKASKTANHNKVEQNFTKIDYHAPFQ